MNSPFRFNCLILRRILFLLAAAALLITGCDSSVEVRGNMAAYLEKTYGQEFTVEMPDFEGINGMWPGVYTAFAAPASQPDLRFRIFWNTGDKTLHYDDTYLTTRWSAEALKEHESAIRDILGQGITLSAFNWDALANIGGAYESPVYQDMSYDQLRTTFGDKFRLVIKVNVPVSQGVDKASEAEKINAVYQRVLAENGIRNYVFWITYLTPDAAAAYDADDLSVSSEKLHQDGKLLNIARFGTLKDSGIPITSREDLFKGFAY